MKMPMIEDPGPVDATPEKMGEESVAGGGLAASNYRGPEQRCELCKHFDGESGCAIHKGEQVDPEGGCDKFEDGVAGEESDEPMGAMESGPEEEAEYR